MNLVVVVQTSGHQQIHKVSLSSSQSVTIGRAWQNDVIVSDDYIDANHLLISMDEDSSIKVSDRDTRNGTRLARRCIASQHPYVLGKPLLIGGSSLALHETDSSVAPAHKLDATHFASQVFGSLPWVIVATLMAIAGILASAYYTASAQVTREALAELFLGLGVMAGLWCLVAGFVGKLFRHKTYMTVHWMLVCVMLLLSVIFMLLQDVLRFNLNSDMSEALLVHGSSAALLLAFVYATLSLSTRLGVTKKFAGASLFAVLPVIFSMVTPMLAEEHERWTDSAVVDRVNLPPAFFVVQAITLESHWQKTERLFVQLDEQVNALNSSRAGEQGPTRESDTQMHVSEMN